MTRPTKADDDIVQLCHLPRELARYGIKVERYQIYRWADAGLFKWRVKRLGGGKGPTLRRYTSRSILPMLAREVLKNAITAERLPQVMDMLGFVD